MTVRFAEDLLAHDWNAGASIRLDRLRTVAAALKRRGEMIQKIVNEAMIRTIVNEAGIEVGETNRDGMLIKGHHRIDAELKLGHKLFFRTSGAPARINCITIDHTAHKITLAADGFSREA
ncbi:hypothetical protein [Bradyrhizobium sp. NAS96.2]|uniref:hypothetical protein n=1 Tax=Bradyrhizobium sp. NAS96.2 TaxID=1680160 RepID=UPI00093E8CD7|nr:hypothetical protein [Bradyrhizobium sp. NAS96.2]OKO80884.1 hypothetical protein AC628_08160 [Bradyrhizobium sp. NAS96.2]